MGLFSGILGAVGSFFGPVGTAVGGAIGGAIDSDRTRSSTNSAVDASNQFNAEQGQITRDFNANQAQLNRDFQTTQLGEVERYDTAMSSTAYQRTVADMQAAGLNPMLAYSQGGASTPTVSAPSGSSASAGSVSGFDKAQAITNSLQATQIAQSIQESQARVENTQADTVLKGAQTARETSSASNIDMSTKEIQARIPNLEEQLHLIRAQEGTELWKQAVMDTQAQLNKIDAGLKNETIGLVEAQTQFERVRTLLANLSVPEARNASNAQDSWWMRNVSPYLPDLLKGTGAAAGVRGLTR